MSDCAACIHVPWIAGSLPFALPTASAARNGSWDIPGFAVGETPTALWAGGVKVIPASGWNCRFEQVHAASFHSILQFGQAATERAESSASV